MFFHKERSEQVFCCFLLFFDLLKLESKKTCLIFSFCFFNNKKSQAKKKKKTLTLKKRKKLENFGKKQKTKEKKRNTDSRDCTTIKAKQEKQQHFAFLSSFFIFILLFSLSRKAKESLIKRREGKGSCFKKLKLHSFPFFPSLHAIYTYIL